MTDFLRCRMKVSADDQALRALWVDHSGWGVDLTLRDSDAPWTGPRLIT